jgi:hypothetical protein
VRRGGRPSLDPFARLGDSRARAGPTATAPMAVPLAAAGPGPMGGSAQGSPFMAPTPANSYSAGPAFPAGFGGAPAGFGGAPAGFGGAPTGYGGVPAASSNPFGAPASAAPYGGGMGMGMGGGVRYQPPSQSPFGAPATYGGAGGIGAPPAPAAAANDPFGPSADPFGAPAMGGGDILQPQNTVRSWSDFAHASVCACMYVCGCVGVVVADVSVVGRLGQSGMAAQPVVVAGGIVDLSASSLAAKGANKNPFGAPAQGKHQWDKPKPNMSLNDMKQTGPGAF